MMHRRSQRSPSGPSALARRSSSIQHADVTPACYAAATASPARYAAATARRRGEADQGCDHREQRCSFAQGSSREEAAQEVAATQASEIVGQSSTVESRRLSVQKLQAAMARLLFNAEQVAATTFRHSGRVVSRHYAASQWLAVCGTTLLGTTPKVLEASSAEHHRLHIEGGGEKTLLLRTHGTTRRVSCPVPSLRRCVAGGCSRCECSTRTLSTR